MLIRVSGVLADGPVAKAADSLPPPGCTVKSLAALSIDPGPDSSAGVHKWRNEAPTVNQVGTGPSEHFLAETISATATVQQQPMQSASSSAELLHSSRSVPAPGATLG